MVTLSRSACRRCPQVPIPEQAAWRRAACSGMRNVTTAGGFILTTTAPLSSPGEVPVSAGSAKARLACARARTASRASVAPATRSLYVGISSADFPIPRGATSYPDTEKRRHGLGSVCAAGPRSRTASGPGCTDATRDPRPLVAAPPLSQKVIVYPSQSPVKDQPGPGTFGPGASPASLSIRGNLSESGTIATPGHNPISPRGRRFKSCQPDKRSRKLKGFRDLRGCGT